MASEFIPGGLKLADCEPTDWFVVFHPETTRWWMRWLAWGRFKHVSCFGFVERAQTWVFFDFHMDRTRIFAVGDHESNAVLGHYSNDTVVVRMAKPITADVKINLPFGAWCVPTVAHIIGLRTCALRPDALFRQCLANGGQIIEPEGSSNENTRGQT